MTDIFLYDYLSLHVDLSHKGRMRNCQALTLTCPLYCSLQCPPSLPILCFIPSVCCFTKQTYL